MLSPYERDRIQLKAIEQAMRAAGVANAGPAPLLPVGGWPTWVRPADMVGEHCFEFACGITAWDEWFLKINKISPA